MITGQYSTFGPTEWPHVPLSQCLLCLCLRWLFSPCMLESLDPGPEQWGSTPCPLGKHGAPGDAPLLPISWCGLRVWLWQYLPRKGVYSPNTSRPSWCHPGASQLPSQWQEAWLSLQQGAPQLDMSACALTPQEGTDGPAGVLWCYLWPLGEVPFMSRVHDYIPGMRRGIFQEGRGSNCIPGRGLP